MQSLLTNDSLPYLLIVVVAVFVHASFQLGVSVLTLLSSHKIGAGARTNKVMSLSLSYLLGAFVTTTLLLATLVTAIEWMSSTNKVTPVLLVTGLLPLIGLAVILFYYREGRGTKLWLPRSFVDYLMKRAKKTKSGVESYMLGSATAFGELPFSIAPMGIIALVIANQSPQYWLTGSAVYSLFVCLPLLFVTLYVSSGHTISSLQVWRENSKRFLQWTSGIALILLALYLASLQTRSA